tara:strand:+ start:2125 stop:2910 length:786 start_codon:yes stop_codon:yes gene_type:complete
MISPVKLEPEEIILFTTLSLGGKARSKEILSTIKLRAKNNSAIDIAERTFYNKITSMSNGEQKWLNKTIDTNKHPPAVFYEIAPKRLDIWKIYAPDLIQHILKSYWFYKFDDPNTPIERKQVMLSMMIVNTMNVTTDYAMLMFKVACIEPNKEKANDTFYTLLSIFKLHLVSIYHIIRNYPELSQKVWSENIRLVPLKKPKNVAPNSMHPDIPRMNAERFFKGKKVVKGVEETGIEVILDEIEKAYREKASKKKKKNGYTF